MNVSRAGALFLAGVLCLAISGCDDGNGPPATPTTVPSSEPSAQATTVTAVTPTANGYQLTPAFPEANFDRMLAFAAIPGSPNEAVVLSQSGEMRRIALDESAPPAVFGDVSSLIIANPGGEEGLLGIAFSPGFQTDNRVFIYYSAGDPRRSVLSRFNVTDGAIDMASERIILEAPQPPFGNHKGGQLAFGPDGFLYWGLGDGGSEGDPLGNGQNVDTLLSSILRLDVSGDGYTVPPDNPFVGAAGVRPEKFAYGLRNPWRFSFDRATGDLWAGDVGQEKWEEVDLITPGGNYGWSVMDGFECFEASSCDRAGLTLPRVVYGHDAGCAIIGGYVYRGSLMPELEGWYIYGDFCSGTVWALDATGNGEPVQLVDSGPTITSFGELPDGEIVVVTFDDAIYRLERAS